MGSALKVPDSARPTARLHITVQVGTERFAFPVGDVEEALDAPVIESVPVAPEGMLGQLRHRGRMVAAWDAHWAFGMPRPREFSRETAGRAALVLRDGTRRLALVVDDVVEMTRLEPEHVQAVPEGADRDGALSGVCMISHGEHALLNVVRVETLLARASAPVTFDSGAAI